MRHLTIELRVPAIIQMHLFEFAHARGQTPGEYVADLMTAWADGPGREWADAQSLDAEDRERDESRHRAITYLRMGPEDRAEHDEAVERGSADFAAAFRWRERTTTEEP